MKLDNLVNTKEKRHCVFVIIILLFTLKLLIVYGMLASKLMSLTTYNDVFSLLDTSELTWTYLSRCVLSLIGKGNTGIWEITKVLLSSIRIEGILTIAGMGILLYSWRHTRPRLMMFVFAIFIICVGLCGIFLYQGFHSTTLMEVVDALQVIGLVILLTCVAFGFLCIYGLIQKIFDYRDVYAVEVIEIED